MPPIEVHVFEPCQITRGPDEIRGQVGSLVFIYTRYPDPDGNRWFVQPGYVGHEQMTNTVSMLQALFGPEAEAVYQRVVTISEVYSKDDRGHYAPTGERREVWDWYTIRQLAKRENLFGRSGALCGRRVVMLWPGCETWEAMLPKVLRLLEISPDGEVVVVGNDRQYWARDYVGMPGETHKPS